MKYTRRYKLKDGRTKWVFSPPEDCIKAGVAEKRVFYDGRKARWWVTRSVQKIEAYKRGTLVAGDISSELNIGQIIGHYLHSQDFLDLANTSQKGVESRLKKVLEVKIKETPVRNFRLKNLNVFFGEKVYKALKENYPISLANSIYSSLSSVFNYCISEGLILVNPLNFIKKDKPEKEEQVFWTREQVRTVVDHAFKEFETRTIGLLILMCYEWVQPISFLTKLKWSQIDLENKTITLYPPKKRTVTLPTEEPILDLLKQQKELVDFQEYVFPHFVASFNGYKPVSAKNTSLKLKKILEETKLPKTLTLDCLYKTALKELVESKENLYDVIQVTGDYNTNRIVKFLELNKGK